MLEDMNSKKAIMCIVDSSFPSKPIKGSFKIIIAGSADLNHPPRARTEGKITAVKDNSFKGYCYVMCDHDDFPM